MVYFDSHLNAIDVKSRVSMPPKYRANVVVESTDDRELLIGKSRFDDCLVCYDYGYVAELRADIVARFGAINSPEKAAASRAAFSGLSPHAIDDAHRITLGEGLRDAICLGRFALFTGADSYFEIWKPETYLAHPHADPQVVHKTRAALAAKGVTL